MRKSLTRLATRTAARAAQAGGVPDLVELVAVDTSEMEQVYRTMHDQAEDIDCKLAADLSDRDRELLQSTLCGELLDLPASGPATITAAVEEARAQADRALEEINGNGALLEVGGLVLASGALTAEGITLPAAAAVALKAGLELRELVERVQQANLQVEQVVDLAGHLQRAYAEFELQWLQLGLDEDRDRGEDAAEV